MSAGGSQGAKPLQRGGIVFAQPGHATLKDGATQADNGSRVCGRPWKSAASRERRLG